MNKTILAPLFTMLVVSCGTVLPSSGVSSSPSGPSSEEPVNTRKVPFNKIGSLVVQVVDAKAMGVVNSKDRPQVSGRKNAQAEDQNYMVKITETYNPNTEITEDQTVQVTFSRVTNTQTTELQTGTESYVATAEALEIERVTDLPGNIVITNVEGNEYRLLSEGVVVQDWISSELATIEFIFDEALTGITLESRSLNASISFITFEGFTYTINQGETVIYEDLEDNDEADNNEALGNITLSGLTEGLTYDITYEGYQVIETITQDEVEGQVDKLYVLYQYTFISFVPLNLNNRPQDHELELDYDDVPLYDKQGYFSDSTRQSFVVDNETGLIYKIENINIASLSGGCVSVQGSPFPFDMRVNEQSELEFYSLHQNSSLVTSHCIKDRFGRKFLLNDKLELFDPATETFFNKYSNYNLFLPTSNGLVLNIDYNSEIRWDRIYKEDGVIFPSKEDTFQVYGNFIQNEHNFFKINEGNIYRISNHSSLIEASGRYGNNLLNRLAIYFWNFEERHYTNYLVEKGIVMKMVDSELWVYYEVFDIFEDLFKESQLNPGIRDFNFDEFRTYYSLVRGKNLTGTKFCDNCEINYDYESKHIVVNSFTLNGSITYELIPEIVNGKWILEPYQLGSYVSPPTTTVTLQPINR